MRHVRIVLGVVIWTAAAWLLWRSYGEKVAGNGDSDNPVRDIIKHATARRANVDLLLPEEVDLAVGDPIFVIDGPDQIRQIGEIELVLEGDKPVRRAWTRRASAKFYDSAEYISSDVHISYHYAPASMKWVSETMLPEHKRKKIMEMVKSAYKDHHHEILAAMLPMVKESFHETLLVVEQDLPPAIAKRREELAELGRKYQHDIVERDVIPLVKAEIWPIVSAKAEPLAEEVGREIWGKVSVWRFGWRFMYDKTPLLPEKNLAKKEFRRFVDDEAMPVLESHSGDFVKVVKDVMKDASRNPKVRSVLRDGLLEIIEDPKLQKIVWGIVRDVVIDNPRVHDVLKRHWTGERAKQALDLALDRVEPTMIDVGELLFGNERDGLTPEFARVLRNKVLLKDRRWLVVEFPSQSGGTSAPAARRKQRLVAPVRIAERHTVDPFLEQLKVTSAERH